ncbi:LysR family transcriptional regulator [Massilia solisilvae]
MRLHQLDLNLLRVLKVVYRTRSVTKASEQLFMTQSAVSNALRRLRDHLDDPLFIRRNEGMVPTALVESIIGSIEYSLRNIEDALHSHLKFDPFTSARLVRLLSNDLAQMVFLPRLVKHLSDVAPGVRLETVETPWDEGKRAMYEGRVDVALGNWPRAGSDYVRVELFDERFVVLMGAQHPLAKQELHQSDYLAARHIDYRPGGESYNALRGKLDKLLAQENQMRNIVFTAAHGLGLASIVAESDVLLTIPSRLAAGMSVLSQGALVVKPLPYPVPSVMITMQWHARADHDPALVWFRQQVIELFQSPSSSAPQAD